MTDEDALNELRRAYRLSYKRRPISPEFAARVMSSVQSALIEASEASWSRGSLAPNLLSAVILVSVLYQSLGRSGFLERGIGDDLSVGGYSISEVVDAVETSE